MSAAGTSPTISERVLAVKRRLPIDEVVEGHIKLSGTAQSRNRRGQCPFHGSSSASFSIKAGARPEDGFAHCFGCGWSGDVVRFVRDILGLDFLPALEECERLAGISQGVTPAPGASGKAPVTRERAPQERREARHMPVDPLDMAQWIWRRARRDGDAVRRYFTGRGVPPAALTDARIAPFRFLAECPCWPWRAGEDPRSAKGMLTAPAIMALVKVPVRENGDLTFVPVGMHLTYLDPAGTGTMVRRKPWAKDGVPDPLLPKRRMLGPVGKGAIVLGEYSPGSHLFVGEGNETVLSAMALADAPDNAVGVATLSLDNLQGGLRKYRGGIWPLHAIEPDAERPGFTIPGHVGAVSVLVDADMAPLRGMRDLRTGEFQGEAVVERKGGAIVRRAITGAERARICGELAVKCWRATGARPVSAIRPPAGMDFNDAVRAGGVA